MKFTTPCFVRVENVEERRQLVKWLVDIGYRIYHNHPNPDSIVTDGSWGGAYLGRWARVGKIDCGENIEQFKALAAMNDENDLNQWYVCDVPYWCDLRQGDWVIKRDTMDHTTFFPSVFHKATAEEIIGHFKRHRNNGHEPDSR